MGNWVRLRPKLMTWLSYGFSIVLLASVIFEYRLKHIDKDGRTIAHKRARRIVLAIAILSILAQQGIAGIKDQRKLKDEAVLRGKVDTANTNIGKLLEHQSRLLMALGTNVAIDPKLRVEILEHSRAVELVSADVSELEQWKTDFKNEQAVERQKKDAEKLRHQISVAEQDAAAKGRVERAWKRSAQLFDFTVRTLQETVRGIAEAKRDKVFTDYVTLPTAPVGDKSVHVASITTGTNLGWSFKISADAIARSHGAEVWLRVQGSCTNRAPISYHTMLRVTVPEPGTTSIDVQSYLWLVPNHPDFSQSFNLEAYQTNTVAWVRRFIAAHAIECDKR
jgi:hypothetical protein